MYKRDREKNIKQGHIMLHSYNTHFLEVFFCYGKVKNQDVMWQKERVWWQKVKRGK